MLNAIQWNLAQALEPDAYTSPSIGEREKKKVAYAMCVPPQPSRTGGNFLLIGWQYSSQRAPGTNQSVVAMDGQNLPPLVEIALEKSSSCLFSITAHHSGRAILELGAGPEGLNWIPLVQYSQPKVDKARKTAYQASESWRFHR